MNTYDAGALVRVNITVSNNLVSPAVPADPTTMKFSWELPGAATSTEYTWPAGGGQIVHDGTGTFHVDLNVPTTAETGIVQVAVTTTGVQAAGTLRFAVNALPIPVP